MSSKKPRIVETSFSEEEYGKRIDRCFTDTVVKGSGGLLLGAALSLLLFRKRSWPVIMGTGFGIGMAFKNCEKELNSINEPPKIELKDIFQEISKFFIISGEHNANDQKNAETLNLCFNDLLVKGSGGLLIGSALSFVSRSSLPVFLGMSFGAGAAYRNCVHEFAIKVAKEESEVEQNANMEEEKGKTLDEEQEQENAEQKDEKDFKEKISEEKSEQNKIEENGSNEDNGNKENGITDDKIEESGEENGAGENKKQENSEKKENYNEPEYFPPPDLGPGFAFPESEKPRSSCPPVYCPPCPCPTPPCTPPPCPPSNCPPHCRPPYCSLDTPPRDIKDEYTNVNRKRKWFWR